MMNENSQDNQDIKTIRLVYEKDEILIEKSKRG